MSEGEDISTGAPPEERASAAQTRVLDPPLSSSERWKLIKLELMEELNGRLWTVLGRIIASVTVVAALLTALGYFQIPAYIQSIFKEKIEQETKNFDKLREEIGREQAAMYAHEKIYIMLFQMYLRDEQTMSKFASKALEEVNQSDTLNSEDMAELKNFIVNGINQMANRSMVEKQYKTFRQEIISKQVSKLPSFANLPSVSPDENFPRGSLGDLLDIYPHVFALDKTLRWSINRLVVKESTDDVAKSVLFREYETSFYPKYREWFDKFEPGYTFMGAYYWATPSPGANEMFLSLNPTVKEFQKKNVQ